MIQTTETVGQCFVHWQLKLMMNSAKLDFIKKRYTTLNYRIGDFKTAVEVI